MFLFVLGIIATIVLFFVLGIELTDEAVEFISEDDRYFPYLDF